MSGSNRDTWRPTLDSAVRLDAAGLPVSWTAEEYRAASWPTPKVSAQRNSRKALTQQHFSGVALEQAVELSAGIVPREVSSIDELSPGAQALWPTPSAGNFNDGEDPASWAARRDRELAKGRNGNGMGTPLGIAVHLWPTPMGRDHKGADLPGRTGGQGLPTQAGGALNPAWVEALMGYPDGWTVTAGRRRPARRSRGSRPAPSPGAASPTGEPG